MLSDMKRVAASLVCGLFAATLIVCSSKQEIAVSEMVVRGAILTILATIVVFAFTKVADRRTDNLLRRFR